MAEYEICVRMFVIDDDEESVAQMCAEIAQNFDEIIKLDHQFVGVDYEESARAGLVNVSYHEVFSNKEARDGSNRFEHEDD